MIWRNWNDGQQRLRALMVGIYDSIRYDALPSRRAPIELVATFDNLTPPFDRSDYVEGKRIRSEELRRYQMRAGFGIGVRGSLAPFHQDNHLEAALTYEPGTTGYKLHAELGEVRVSYDSAEPLGRFVGGSFKVISRRSK